MIKDQDTTTVIVCDRCGYSEQARTGGHNTVFFGSGWLFNPRAKKYVHVCTGCQTKKQREVIDWSRNKFSNVK